jgi:DNA-binding LacI/PurR family transcriptional regulator
MPGSVGPSAKARTLEEVADITGVSRATVSRVLNGGSVAPKTRARVEAAMVEHGYHPNLAARSLASGRTGVVGLVLHSSASALRCDDHFLLLHQGITEALSLQTTGVMEWFAHRPPPEILANILSSRFVDGMIATTTALDDPLVDGLVASDIPTVVVGNRRFVASAATVDIDERAAAVAAVEHHLERGARRIGHITGLRGTVSAEARLAGYYRALDTHGVRERFVAEGRYSENGGYRAMTSLWLVSTISSSLTASTLR